MRATIKTLLPKPVLDLRLAWIRCRQRQGEKRAYRLTGGQIVSGPFAGLRMVAETGGIPLAPALFGTYEMEIHPFLEQAITSGFDLVINIGAGQGYYSAGLLMRLPEARAVAFESDPERRRLIGEVSALNGLGDRTEVEGHCDAASLQSAIESGRRVLIICDIESGERDLLDPVEVPGLRDSDVIVELHDFLVPGTGELIRRRFSPTHEIESAFSRPRTADDAPASERWRADRVAPLLSERRPCKMEWLWLRRPGDDG